MRQEIGYQQSLLLSGFQTLLQLIYFLLFQILRTKFLLLQVQNSMRVIWRSNLFNRNQLKLQFLPSYRFLKDLQEFKTFNNLSTLQMYTDADADTYYKKVSSFYFQKNPRNTSTNVLQRKGEVTLSFPIDSNQFQQFCKQLNTKEIILCTDLLQQELYGK